MEYGEWHKATWPKDAFYKATSRGFFTISSHYLLLNLSKLVL